jgi:predicted DNA-binding protein
MTATKMTPKTPNETLPRPAGELDDLASYYDTHDTSTEMEHGQWVDPRPMKTTSLRLPADVVEALKARAHQRGMRYTALLREIIESAVHNELVADSVDLAQINDRLARIEAAITRQSAQSPQARHASGEA